MQLIRRRPEFLGVLALRDYRKLWLASGFSDIGLSLWFLAAAWMALELTDSQAWVGLVGGIVAVPAIAITLFAGAMADRFDRRRIVVFTQYGLLAAGAVAAGLVLSGVAQAWHLLLVSLAMGVVLGIASPAYDAFVVDLVGKSRLFAANSMAQFANFSGEIAAPLIVGVLIATVGVGSTFTAALIAFAVASLIITQVGTKASARPRAGRGGPSASVFADIKVGIGFVGHTPGLLPLMAVASQVFFAAAVMPLIPVYARDVLEIGGFGFGVLMAALGVGFITGSLLGAISGGLPRKALTLLVLVLVWDAGMVGFGFSRSYPLSATILFLMGTAGALTENLIVTSIQGLATDDVRGRVMSIHRLVDSLFPLGIMFGGFVAAAVSNEFALILAAALSTGVVVAALGSSKALRRL